MSRQVDFSPLFCTQSIFRCNKANEIVATYSNLNMLAIATDIGPPILVNLKNESFKSFNISKNINFSTPISIAVNQKNNIVITGHSDGTICIFSVDDNYELVAVHRDLHKQPITAIGFAPKTGDFYIGDITGLITKISFGKVLSKSLSEKEVYQDNYPIMKFLFPQERYRYEFGIALMSDHFVLIDPKSDYQQVADRYPKKGNFEQILSVAFVEGERGVVNIYAFSGKECHYFTIGSDVSLICHGIAYLYDDDSKEYTTRALNWNSKMIAIITNNSVVKFINASDIALSIERGFKKYDKSIVQRRQSPLSQAIIVATLSTETYNEYLYCILPKNIIKMYYTSWEFIIDKFLEDKNWDDAILMIINASAAKVLDVIGLPDRISERNLSIKQLCEKVVTQYLNYALGIEDQDQDKDDDLINRAFRDCIRLSSQFSIQKFVVSDMLPKIIKSGYGKQFYLTIFRNRKVPFNGYINPEFVKNFLNFCKDDLRFAESCLMGINIPQVYANDIAAIIYNMKLIQLFTKIMLFTFRDFITLCNVIEEEPDYKNFLEFIFTNDLRSLSKRLSNNGQQMVRYDSFRGLEQSVNFRKVKKNGLDSSVITGRKKAYNDDDDDNSSSKMYGYNRYQEEGDEEGYSIDEMPKNDRKIVNHINMDDEELLQLRVLAQRTLCLWLFCPAPMIGFMRIDKLFNFDDNLECATIVLRKCSEILPLKYHPEHTLDLSVFADSIMFSIDKFDLDFEAKYTKFYPILNIICPLYADNRVTVTRFAIRLTVFWCFNCFEQPQSLRISVLNNVLSKYPSLINEKYYMEYSTAAGFIFAVQNKYLESKRYDIIVSAMINEKEYQSNIFEFLTSYKKDVEEVKNAILQNIEGLTIIDSDSLFHFVFENFDDLHSKIFIKLEKNKLIKYLYLKSFVGEPTNTNASKYIDNYFELLCQYSPNEAIIFYQENCSSLDIEKSKYSCKKYGIYDCLVEILKSQNQYEEIFKYIEKALVDILEYDNANSIEIESEEQLSDYPKILQVLNGIDALLQYQKEILTNEDGNIKDIKNLKFLSFFDFPFYISREKSFYAQKILFLLYSRFVIRLSDYIPANLLFKQILIQISQLKFDEIQEILSTLFNQVTFKKFFTESINKLFVEDTCYLIDNTFKKSTKGIKTTINVCCSSCLKPLFPPQYCDVFIFPCGHIFHYEYECVRTGYDEDNNLIKPEECPICRTGETQHETLEVQVPAELKKLPNSKLNRLLRRLDYALNKNYGTDIDEYRPSSVYFAPDIRNAGQSYFQAPQEVKISKAIPVHI